MNEIGNIHKIWGERRRILLNDKVEVDLLYVKKDGFCSIHNHKKKYNKFFVIKGRLEVETELGMTMLEKHSSWIVAPPIFHRFRGLKDSIVLEIAYVNKGKINPDDINRIKQGGRIINGDYLTENEMRKKGMLKLTE
jgi:quercetin dioxygenase-like cupin family protein